MKTQDVTISLQPENVRLSGILTVPEAASKIIVFAHGSGSGRLSPRNQYVASVLNKEGIATLLLDLLTPEEDLIDESTRSFRFDIPLLAKRLMETCRWIEKNPELQPLKIGFFGASTGSAAALIASKKLKKTIFAVVSRGGRPDLAKEALAEVAAPTLLLVGGDDFGVIELNQEAFEALRGVKELKIIPGATHLFEEPGTLEQVAHAAAKWFKEHGSSPSIL